jgi:hypothetical protein
MALVGAEFVGLHHADVPVAPLDRGDRKERPSRGKADLRRTRGLARLLFGDELDRARARCFRVINAECAVSYAKTLRPVVTACRRRAELRDRAALRLVERDRKERVGHSQAPAPRAQAVFADAQVRDGLRLSALAYRERLPGARRY